MMIYCVIIGLAVVVIVLHLLSIFAYRKRMNRRKNNGQNSPNGLQMDFSAPKELKFKELAQATNNFADANKLGQGGFGGVYRGHLRKLNVDVAVKKKSRDSPQGMKEYKSEVKTISGLRNRNLVRLIGWCHKKKGLLFGCHKEEQLLLVYEFMRSGSLFSHLHDQNTLLTWATRYRIAKGLASALLYLQEEWEPNRYVVHRDIKSENVLLDSDFDAKLGDFGLARVVNRGQQVQTSVVAGTVDYMAPECFNGINTSKESDVYSFGIVALEIATEKRPDGSQSHTNHRNIANWVRGNYRMGNLMGSADPRLGAYFNEQEMKRLLIVGIWCANPDDSRRPAITEVVYTLNSSNEDSLPDVRFATHH